MTQRSWLLILTTAIGLGPLPACTLLNRTEQPNGRLSGEGPDVRIAATHAFPSAAEQKQRLAPELIGDYPGIMGAPVAAEKKGPALPPPPVEDPAVVLPVQAPPPEPFEPVVTALHFFLKNQPNEALALLQKYDAQTQEFFLGILPAIGPLTQKGLNRMSMAEVAALQQQLQSVYYSLRSHSELIIDKACFCESIEGYGDYKALPDDHRFQPPGPGRPGEKVRLYVELRNFHCESHDGFFVTRLASSVEMRDEKGERVWIRSFQDREKPLVSLAARNDYFNNYSFFLPESLRPGHYQLTIRIQDQTRQPARTAEKTLSLYVAGTP